MRKISCGSTSCSFASLVHFDHSYLLRHFPAEEERKKRVEKGEDEKIVFSNKTQQCELGNYL